MDMINIIVDANSTDKESITELFDSDSDINVAVEIDDVFKTTKLITEYRPDLLHYLHLYFLTAVLK